MRQRATFTLVAATAILLACNLSAMPLPAPTPGSEPATMLVETQAPAPVLPTEQVPTPPAPTETTLPAFQKTYANDQFGLGFQYPSDWFGPSEYVSDGTLRVEVGSDVVYPYGEQPEQAVIAKNSYSIVIQYIRNNQNSYWQETYQTILALQDGGTFSDGTNLFIRLRQFSVGRFTGFEYLTTHSEAAQMDYLYVRSILLYDGQSNDVLSIVGQPNNVEVASGAAGMDVYRSIDEANLPVFEGIIASITVP